MAISKYSTTTVTGLNQFFNQTTTGSEQGLVQSLVDEMISIYGQALIYIPRNLNNFDQMYFTDDQSSYTTPFTIEMLIENITGFSPQPNDNIFSKFGLEIRSQIVFSVSVDRFATVIGTPTSIPRPREGDIIYLPIHKKCFQIKFTENKEIFYELGGLYTYKMTCELFEYSNETFNTGIPDIDILQVRYSTDDMNNAITDENGIMLTDENGNVLLPESYDLTKIDPLADNDALKDAAAGIVDWSQKNPFGEVE